MKRHLEVRSCVKVEMAVLDSSVQIVRTVSVDVEQHLKKKMKPSCVKVEAGVLCTPSLIILTVSVNLKQH